MILDLRIPQNQKYQQVVLDEAISRYLAGEIDADAMVKAVDDGWNELNEEIGVDEQLEFYKATIGANDRRHSVRRGARRPSAPGPHPHDTRILTPERPAHLGRAHRPPLRPADGAAGGHRDPLLRDLPAHHLGLPRALALRAGAGRLHAQVRRLPQLQEAPHRLAAVPLARHLGRARRRSHWLVLALAAPCSSTWLARYFLDGRATILGTLGRLRHRLASPTGCLLVTVVTFAPGGVPGTLVTTLLYVVIGVTVQFLLGLGLALLCAQPIRGRNFFRVLFFVPLMVTPVGIAYAFRMLADMQKGPFAPLAARLRRQRMVLGHRGLVGADDGDRSATPGSGRPSCSSCCSPPSRTSRATRSRRRGSTAPAASQIFRDITWPAIAPVAATVVLIRLIEAFKIIDLPNVLTGGGPGLATEFDDAARLHRLAHPGSRRLGGGRLHAALRLDRRLRLLLQLRRPADARRFEA